MGEGPEVKGKWVANDQKKVGKQVTRAVFRGAQLVKPGATLVSLRCVGKRIIAKFEGPGTTPVAATPVAATPPSADDPPEPPAKRARGEALAGCRFSIAGIAGRDRAELRETAIGLGAEFCYRWPESGATPTHIFAAPTAQRSWPKVDAGLRARAVIVDAAWVSACAANGRRVDVAPHAMLGSAPAADDPEAEWERALAAWEGLEREVDAQAAAAQAAITQQQAAATKPGPLITYVHIKKGMGGRDSESDPIMCLSFGNFKLQVIGDPDKGASVSQISEQEAERDLLSGLAPYDICGDRWDPRAVLRRMDELATRENGEPRAISDVLSDQRVFAGLGNTLKIEAMFALRLFPRRCVRDIPTAVRIELIDWVRDCAMRWLALKQHFRMAQRGNAQIRPVRAG